MPNFTFVMLCLISGGKYRPKKTYPLMFTNLRGSRKNLGPLVPFQGELWHFENCQAMRKSVNLCIFTPKLTLTALNAMNSETWLLNDQERKEVNKIEIWAWKALLGLPPTTPTPAIIYATGSLYASIRVDIRQLIVLS